MPLAKNDLTQLHRAFSDGSPHEIQDALLADLRTKYASDEKALERLLKFDRKEPGMHDESIRRRDELSEKQKAHYRLQEIERVKREDESIAREKARRTIEGE